MRQSTSDTTTTTGEWAGGTHFRTRARAGNLELAGHRSGLGSSLSGITEIDAGRIYNSGGWLIIETNTNTYNGYARYDRGGDAGNDLVAEVDVRVDSGDNAGIVYRTDYWSPNRTTFGWWFGFSVMSDQFIVGYGANGNNPGEAMTEPVGRATAGVGYGQTVRLRIECRGSHHSLYADGNLIFDFYSGVHDNVNGPIGFFGNNSTARYDNVALNAETNGNRTTGDIDVGVVGRYVNSSVSWNHTNNGGSVRVQVSHNGGRSWTNCVNGGAIPGFSSDQDLRGNPIRFRQILDSNGRTMQTPQMHSFTYSVTGSKAVPKVRQADGSWKVVTWKVGGRAVDVRVLTDGRWL